MQISHMPTLKKEIENIIESMDGKIPSIINFNEGMEFPHYKITIEKTEPDTFTDKNGQKWKKVK